MSVLFLSHIYYIVLVYEYFETSTVPHMNIYFPNGHDIFQY